MAQWSKVQDEEKPLNLLFATVKRGWLYLFAIETREDILALEEHFERLLREMTRE